MSLMDKHTLEVLDYYVLLAEIAGYSQSELGKEQILKLTPQKQLPQIKRNHPLLGDAIQLLNMNLAMPRLEFATIKQILFRLSKTNSILEASDLWQIMILLSVVDDIIKFLARDEIQELHHFQLMGNNLNYCSGLYEHIKSSIDANGKILDSASPELSKIRRSIIGKQNSIQKKLDAYLRSSSLEDAIQEKFVTMRNGRYVIPVRREEKSRIRGVVHDHSNSGRTLFVEPDLTLAIGNELTTLYLQERDECRKILAQLSDKVRKNNDELCVNQWIIAQFDMVMAIARWGKEYDCSIPKFAMSMELLSARHPILQQQLRQEQNNKKIVPLNLNLNPKTKVLAVTGSNTGGKTVVLKTVGLLSLIAQAGLPVPADSKSRFSVFDTILADIGDEQSLQANLSTFSAHLSNIKNILQTASKKRTLVLLDELGTGTDPLEGGALACAVLQQLANYHGVVLTTTHLGVVKKFVHEHPLMINSSVRFNIESLQPEYILDIGRPGASHALKIAKKLGLSKDVLETAEGFLSSDHLRLEGMLAEMEEEQRRISQKEEQVQGVQLKLENDHKELNDELTKLRRERKQLMHEAYKQAENVVSNTRKQLEGLLANIKGKTDQEQQKNVTALRKKIKNKNKKIQTGLKQTAPKPEKPLSKNELQIGQMVWIEKLHEHGKITNISADKNKVSVVVEGLNFVVKAKNLGKSMIPNAKVKQSVTISKPRVQGRVKHQLNLIGCRTDEAKNLVEQFLSQAIMANLDEVRIIHGFGSGKLQRAVHQILQQDHNVKSCRLADPQKDGVDAGQTIVSL